jgi:hypothetical protein
MKLTKIFITAHIPSGLEQAWLQHVRDFDTAHKGCHFEIPIEAPDISLREALEKLRVDPALTFTKIFERKSKEDTNKDPMDVNCTCLKLGLHQPLQECLSHPCPSWQDRKV